MQDKNLVMVNYRLEQITEDIKVLDVITNLKRRTDKMFSTLQNLKLLEETSTNLTKVDQNKRDDIVAGFVTKKEFLESEKKLYKMFDIKGDKIEENKRLIEEIVNLMRFKVSEKEIKLLEEYLLGKIEDTKIQIKKKYCQKVDTEKTIRMIEVQVKYIIDTYCKKEKPDNWLIAKKPMNGFECASCDSYLGGDLTTKNSHVHYKYPMRDPSDAAYRVSI